MSTQDLSERQKFVEAIKTPLGFFSLAVLVVEALLGSLALASSGFDRTFLLYAIVGILVLIVVLVAAIAIRWPEALWGERYSALEESFAAGLGANIHIVFDAYLANLSSNEREEAYAALRDTLTGSGSPCSKSTEKFCRALGESITGRAQRTEMWKKFAGVVP